MQSKTEKLSAAAIIGTDKVEVTFTQSEIDKIAVGFGVSATPAPNGRLVNYKSIKKKNKNKNEQCASMS